MSNSVATYMEIPYWKSLYEWTANVKPKLNNLHYLEGRENNIDGALIPSMVDSNRKYFIGLKRSYDFTDYNAGLNGTHIRNPQIKSAINSRATSSNNPYGVFRKMGIQQQTNPTYTMT